MDSRFRGLRRRDAEANIRAANGPQGELRMQFVIQRLCLRSSFQRKLESSLFFSRFSQQELDSSLRWNDEHDFSFVSSMHHATAALGVPRSGKNIAKNAGAAIR
jgi:hypothetical protein